MNLGRIVTAVSAGVTSHCLWDSLGIVPPQGAAGVPRHPGAHRTSTRSVLLAGGQIYVGYWLSQEDREAFDQGIHTG